MMIRTIALIALCGAATSALAQAISYTGGTYTQNFDGLPQSGSVVLTGRGPHPLEGQLAATGVVGWYAGNFGGSSTNTEVRAHNGSLASSAGRGVISFGDDNSGERALGALSTSNQICTFGALLVNDTGTTLTEIDIRYIGEQWRRGNVTQPNVLTFRYGFGTSIQDATTPFPLLDFTAPNTQASPTEVPLDGNDPANQALVHASIPGIQWPAGATLAISWSAVDLSGQDDGLAIDSFELSAIAAPTVCYANCDGSTTTPILNIDDFTCFINEFAIGLTFPYEQQVTAYANCDGSTTAPVLNIDDFTCFINEFAHGCP